jgi:hypothetical protein
MFRIGRWKVESKSVDRYSAIRSKVIRPLRAAPLGLDGPARGTSAARRGGDRWLSGAPLGSRENYAFFFLAAGFGLREPT